MTHLCHVDVLARPVPHGSQELLRVLSPRRPRSFVFVIFSGCTTLLQCSLGDDLLSMKEFVLSGNHGSTRQIDFAAELNDEQRAVVEAGDGPMLVLAGAGSGKTRVITYRVAWLLAHGVPAERILLLTFTNKAAREMSARIELLLGSYPHGLWAGTFHSIANRLLRTYGRHAGFAPNFSILDEEDANDLMKLCVKECKIDTKGVKFPSPGVLRGMVSYACNANKKFADVVDERHPHFAAFAEQVLMVANRYAQKKLEAQAMDFDDLLVVLLKLLRNTPDIRAKLADQFAYVFVDEFQDTNIVQADLVHELASSHGNILAVGDDAQSIYSFRAAEIRNMLDFTKRYPSAQMYRLVVNYRSTPQILAVANAVIARNENQFAKELIAAVPGGDKPLLIPANSASQEAQYVAEQIATLITEGVAMREIAVLFRAAFHSQQVEFELMRRGIPYEYRGGMKFFERAHIKDALAHLRVLQNHRDIVSWMRVLALQPGVGATTAGSAAAKLTHAEDIADALRTTPMTGAKTAYAWRATQTTLVAKHGTKSPADALRAFAGSSYQDYLEAEYPNYRERLDDLEQLGVFAEQYTDAHEFLDAVSLTADFSKTLGGESRNSKVESGDEDKIILSTIHQAKGLEWEAVFIIHLADGMFPNARAIDEGAIEEERRLFYVATTRARRKLYLSYPITSGYEHVELRQKSQFLEETPSELLEEVRLRYSFQAQSTPAPTRKSWYDSGDAEPTIVLDDDGERVTKPMPKSFLGDF